MKTTDQERVTLRTAGKAISTGATPPEAFTNIVLEAIVDPMDGFVFRVKTDGSGVKSPGFDNDKMFPSHDILTSLRSMVASASISLHKERFPTTGLAANP